MSDSLYRCNPPKPPTQQEAQDAWQRIYPIFMRTALNHDQYRFTDNLVYVASSVENAIDWCERNTDIEPHDTTWWFVVTQEAVDGEYSGIKGVMTMLDWNAKVIDVQPLDGYTV